MTPVDAAAGKVTLHVVAVETVSGDQSEDDLDGDNVTFAFGPQRNLRGHARPQRRRRGQSRRVSETIDGHLGAYLARIAGGMALLVAAPVFMVLVRRRAVLIAGATAIVGFLAWTRTPGTGITHSNLVLTPEGLRCPRPATSCPCSRPAR